MPEWISMNSNLKEMESISLDISFVVLVVTLLFKNSFNYIEWVLITSKIFGTTLIS